MEAQGRAVLIANGDPLPAINRVLKYGGSLIWSEVVKRSKHDTKPAEPWRNSCGIDRFGAIADGAMRGLSRTTESDDVGIFVRQADFEWVPTLTRKGLMQRDPRPSRTRTKIDQAMCSGGFDRAHKACGNGFVDFPDPKHGLQSVHNAVAKGHGEPRLLVNLREFDSRHGSSVRRNFDRVPQGSSQMIPPQQLALKRLARPHWQRERKHNPLDSGWDLRFCRGLGGARWLLRGKFGFKSVLLRRTEL